MSKISIPCECLDKLNLDRMYGMGYDGMMWSVAAIWGGGFVVCFVLFLLLFLNIQNQSAAGNVIQLNKKQ